MYLNSVEGRIQEWVRGLEPWMQELFDRVSISPTLSQQDIERALDLLIDGDRRGIGAGDQHGEDRPAVTDGQMALLSIEDVADVNALAEDQRLAFAPSGLNLIYGPNGAGKSGYARILKYAGRVLDRERLLPHAIEEERRGDVPSATVVVRVGDETLSEQVIADRRPSALLGRICVFDARTATRYVTARTEVDYIPIELAGLQRLGHALQAMAAELKRRVAAAKPSRLDLSPYPRGTRVFDMLSELSPGTLERWVVDRANLSDEEQRQRTELRAQLALIEADQSAALSAAAKREAKMVDALRSDLAVLERHVDAGALANARAELDALTAARADAERAGTKLEGLPVKGVGTPLWRALWRAAKEFAERHQSDALPPKDESTPCPLCMQALDPDARRRLQELETLDAGELNARGAAAERAVSARRAALPDVDAFVERYDHAFDLIGRETGQLGDEVLRWIDMAEARLGGIADGKPDDSAPLDERPDDALARWVAQRREQADRHAAQLDPQVRDRVRAELAELDARAMLAERLDSVLEHLRALRRVDELSAVRRQLGTSKISLKLTEFSKSFIQGDLRRALNEQLSALAFQGLSVEPMNKTSRGILTVGLVLTSSDVTLADVLSDGEQRRLALAMFLAETAAGYQGTPIVVDDPVSTLDDDGRRHVAKTLTEIASSRQVIAFTHDLSFVRDVERETAEQDVPLELQRLERHGMTAGYVEAGSPSTVAA